MTERLLTKADVAELLGVKARTIDEWVQKGKIPSLKVGRATRFRRAEIEAWLEQGRRGPEVASRPQRQEDLTKEPGEGQSSS